MWFTALMIGFAGSLHCLGMCSPLAVAVTGTQGPAFIRRLVYNAGRIIIYATMGAAVSGAGHLLPLGRLQNIISILLGVVLILAGLGIVQKITIPGLTPLMVKFSTLLKKHFTLYLTTKTWGAILFLGALNGLLPCGLTVIALTWCLTLQGPADGFNFMLLFGAGTLPVMLGLTGIIPSFVKKFNVSIHKITIATLVFSGCMLIARTFYVHLPHSGSVGEGIVDIILCR